MVESSQEKSLKQTLYYDIKLSEAFIKREGYVLMALQARENPGKDVCLRTLAVSDQDQSIFSKNDPIMMYKQGKKHVFPECVTELFSVLEDKE